MNMIQFPCMQDSAGENVYCPSANCSLTEKTTFFSKNGLKYFRKGIFIAKPLLDCKSEKYETFRAFNMAPYWATHCSISPQAG